MMTYARSKLKLTYQSNSNAIRYPTNLINYTNNAIKFTNSRVCFIRSRTRMLISSVIKQIKLQYESRGILMKSDIY